MWGRALGSLAAVGLSTALAASSGGQNTAVRPWAVQAHYGPPGSDFVAAFPSKPKTARDTAGLLQNFPSGAHAYAYWVSPNTDIFGRTSPCRPGPASWLLSACCPRPIWASAT